MRGVFFLGFFLSFYVIPAHSAPYVEPELVEEMSLDEEQPQRAILHLEGSLDLSKLPKNKFIFLNSARAGLVDKLKKRNQAAAEKLIARLKAMPKDQVQEVTPIWLTNSLRIRASKTVLESLFNEDKVSSVVRDTASMNLQEDEGNGTLATSPKRGETGWGVEKVRAPELWKKGFEGQGVVVAVIDSGATITHPDLAGQLWSNPGEIDGNGIDDDKNGLVDDVHGWDYIDDVGAITDIRGHGTQTAGLVAGNGKGGIQTGVAPKAKLMLLRTCCGMGTKDFESSTWLAMQYALEMGAHLISMSASSKPKSGPNAAAWRKASEVLLEGGLIHVNSAGNLGPKNVPTNIGSPATNPPAWFPPALSYVGKPSSMITVGSADRMDLVRPQSSRGPVTWEDVTGYNDYVYDRGKKPGLLKPEVCGPSEVPSLSKDGTSYTTSFTGTSSATPQVAGVVALLLSARPGLTVAQVTESLQMPLNPNLNNDCGAGRVDAVATVEYALSHFGNTR